MSLSTDQVEAKLNTNNVFTIAKRTVGGQDLIYMSAKLINNIWVLAEIKVTPGSTGVSVSMCGCVVLPEYEIRTKICIWLDDLADHLYNNVLVCPNDVCHAR